MGRGSQSANGKILMREPFPDYTIGKRTCHRRNQVNYKDRIPRTKKDKHGGGTSAGEGPAQTKDKATNQVTWNRFVLLPDDNLIAVNRFHLHQFDHLYQQDSRYDGRTDYAEHMKILEVEHFINTEPGDSLTFIEGETEQHSNEDITGHFHDQRD